MPKKQIRTKRVVTVFGIAATISFVSGIYFFFSWKTLYLWVLSALLLLACEFILNSRWICPYCRKSLRRNKISMNLNVKRCPHCNCKLDEKTGRTPCNEIKLSYFEAQEHLKKEKRVQLHLQRKYKRRQEQREHIKMLRKKKKRAKFQKKVHLFRQKKRQEKYIREIEKRKKSKLHLRKREKMERLRKHELQQHRIRSERQKLEKKRTRIAKQNAQRMEKRLQYQNLGVNVLSESTKINKNFREKLLFAKKILKNWIESKIAQLRLKCASIQKRLVTDGRETGAHVAQKHYNMKVILREVKPYCIAVMTLASTVLLTGIYHSMAIEEQDSSTSTNIQMQSMASNVEAIHLVAEAVACNQAKRVQNVAGVLLQKDAQEVQAQESENAHKPEVQQIDETETQQSTQAIQPEQQTQAERTSLGQYKLTFYCPCEICNGEFETQTTSGAPPKEGKTIAVDASIIPMGSEIYIDGFGTYYAEDTGGAIKGNRIDIFVDTHEKALEMGEKYANVYIVQ